MPQPSLSLQLSNDFGELERLQETTTSFLKSHGVNGQIIYTINLALEEMVTNVIKYGYDDQSAHLITINLNHHGDAVSAEIVDDGHEFNPLDRAPVDTTKPLEDREIGGLGIHLVRKMLDEVRYSRVEGANRFFMKKSLGPQGGTPAA
jgi:anti-sigma regulatory factor (Ser/Thr protein kinase)